MTVVAAIPLTADTLRLVYTLPDGTLKQSLLSRADEANVQPATRARPWAFDGDGEAFQLTVEARRIDLAFLFDPMMAVHASNVEPLPHQITAVYESMLPRQPLRFVLADDPGSGKTIMAGLYMRELIMRADARRILVVAPGGLAGQWRLELFKKFGLDFRLFSRDLEQASPSGNPFEDHDQLVVRLDQIARSDELQTALCAASWDIVVFDEAHKLAAHYFFPERRAHTVNYELSSSEQDLYDIVTTYVTDQMGKAERLVDGKRRGSAGFALTALQRRVASSPAAIHESLKRRREKLERRLSEVKQGRASLAETPAAAPPDDDDLDAGEQEALEEVLVDGASASQTATEPHIEIQVLRAIERWSGWFGTAPSAPSPRCRAPCTPAGRGQGLDRLRGNDESGPWIRLDLPVRAPPEPIAEPLPPPRGGAGRAAAR